MSDIKKQVKNRVVNVMLTILAAICAGVASISSAVPVVGSAIVGATTALEERSVQQQQLQLQLYWDQLVQRLVEL